MDNLSSEYPEECATLKKAIVKYLQEEVFPKENADVTVSTGGDIGHLIVFVCLIVLGDIGRQFQVHFWANDDDVNPIRFHRLSTGLEDNEQEREAMLERYKERIRKEIARQGLSV